MGTFSNGAIHWVNRSSVRKSIYAFDLAEEEFREILMPGWFPIDENVRVLLGGCLCVGLKNGRGCEIWGMTEYAVPESWVKFFGFEEFDIPDVFASTGYGWIGSNWDLCFVTEGGTVVIKLFDTHELVRIECRCAAADICLKRWLGLGIVVC